MVVDVGVVSLRYVNKWVALAVVPLTGTQQRNGHPTVRIPSATCQIAVEAKPNRGDEPG
jgi:hypothetical protein